MNENHADENVKSIEVSVPTKLTEEMVSTLLSTASSTTCGFDWWKEERHERYEAAKAELVAEGKDPTIEDVWARMLFNGDALMLLETESNWHWKGFPEGTVLTKWQVREYDTEPEGGTWKRVALDDIVKGFRKYLDEKPASGLDTIEEIIEDGDFWDADCVMQYAAYGEVVYG